jgi:hypothetical protein
MNLKTKTLPLILLLAVGLGCGYSKPKSAMPSISQLNPGSKSAGSGPFILEVDGTNFATNAAVNFNGTAEPTIFANSTKLTASIPASAIMTSGMVSVTVTNPNSSGMYGTGSVMSAPATFTIN